MAFTERSICWGSPYEQKLFTADFEGCDPGTYSDHTLWTECGYWKLRERQEAVLRDHLPFLAQYLATDAQQQLFDHFVRRRFQGGQGPNEFATQLIDSTQEAPLPEFEQTLYDALARASKNVNDVLYQGQVGNSGEKKLGLRWIRGRSLIGSFKGQNCGYYAMVLPPETASMKSALADMKTTYEAVFGGKPESIWPNQPPAIRFSPYWVVLEDLLEPNYMGSGWQESWGEQGSDSVHLPFPRIKRLYYVDEKNRIKPKKPLSDYLDKWAPGWRGTFAFLKAAKAIDAGRLSAYSPAAMAAAKEAEKKAAAEQKAREATELKMKKEAQVQADAKQQAALSSQRTALAIGGSVIVAGAVALWYVNRKKSNG